MKDKALVAAKFKFGLAQLHLWDGNQTHIYFILPNFGEKTLTV